MYRRIAKSIQANTLVGMFLAIPVVVTLWVFNFLVKLATDWLVEQELPYYLKVGHSYPLRFLTLIAFLLVFYLIGLLTRNILGRRLYHFGDKVLERIPVIRNIYMSVRQISESLFTQRKTLFKEVVMIQYPRKGLYSMGFVTALVPPRVRDNMKTAKKNEDCVSVFIATTPNPTSGVLILAPRSELIPLSISVSDALTFIMSAGAVAPGTDAGVLRPTLLDKLENWLRQDSEEAHTLPKQEAENNDGSAESS